MEKKLEIVQHVNLLDEAFILLFHWINKDNLEEARAKYADNYLLEINNYNKKFDSILEIYNCVKDKFKERKELIEYYFKMRDGEMSTFCTLAIFWDYHNHDNKPQSYEERFKTITEEQKIREYAKAINCEEAVNTPVEKLSTLMDLISFIETSSYDKDAKWEAIKIFNNQERYYNEASGILQEVIDLIEEKFSNQIAEIEKGFYEYWHEYQKNNDILDTIKERLNISWRFSEKGIIVAPLIFFPFSVTVSVDDVENRSKDIVRISVIMNERFILVDKRIKKEDVVNVGKLLCDKSKVDVLEYISKKPCYGKEIANELNLSTATISYHVNALLKIGFIKADVNSNKVYYTIDRERISAYLMDVRNYFIELGGQ